ncbi:MAG: hypothetical protein NZ455_16075 [Bacteroidia bacterium]|nr:hypothetical protein [Bacteroidia bacterium]MDW8348418.1 hypothetical protein [Bacteroidia bacterium]
MGVSLAALGSGYYALRVRFGATHCLTACSVSLTQQPLDVLPCFYTYICFTLFNLDYQILTRLKFFTLFEL